MKYIAIALLLFLQGCAVLAPPDDWTRGDTASEILWQAMNVVDYGQTKDIQRHPNVIEANWLSQAVLGRNPGTSETAQLMVAYALGHYLVSKYLPADARPYWHVIMITGKGVTIRNNHSNGLRIDGHSH